MIGAAFVSPASAKFAATSPARSIPTKPEPRAERASASASLAEAAGGIARAAVRISCMTNGFAVSGNSLMISATRSGLNPAMRDR